VEVAHSREYNLRVKNGARHPPWWRMGLAFAWAGATALQVDAAPVRAVSADRVDARAVLPGEASPKAAYVRYYQLKTIRDDNDTPFTTSSGFRLAHARRVWLAIFVLPIQVAPGEVPGIHVVSRATEIPQPVHGGCVAVNLIAEAATGETLASWCNITDGPPVNGMPPPLPVYLPNGSPFGPPKN
jgi:hypothetical protein